MKAPEPDFGKGDGDTRVGIRRRIRRQTVRDAIKQGSKFTWEDFALRPKAVYVAPKQRHFLSGKVATK